MLILQLYVVRGLSYCSESITTGTCLSQFETLKLCGVRATLLNRSATFPLRVAGLLRRRQISTTNYVIDQSNVKNTICTSDPFASDLLWVLWLVAHASLKQRRRDLAIQIGFCRGIPQTYIPTSVMTRGLFSVRLSFGQLQPSAINVERTW